jgi:Metal binding domain of Ada
VSTTAEKSSWRLIGADGLPYCSDRPGTLGGHRGTRIYGRLDCRAALQALSRGGYRRNRVFFADERAAQAAGYRPCAVCLPAEYAQWKAGGRITRPGQSPER